MTTDIKCLQTPDKTLVIILGASEWPDTDDFTPSVAFAHAAQRVRDYFTDCFKVPEGNLLSLFDKTLLAQEMDTKISKFLKENAEKANQVITYCIGHGQITSKRDGLYLPIRKTQKHNPEFSSLNVEVLMRTIGLSAPQLKRIYILDCCFAGKAFSFLQNSAMGSDEADGLLRHTLRHANRTESYTALFASGPNNSAILLPDETNTFFTEAFLQIATNATAFLSLLDIQRRMNTCLDDLVKIYDQTHDNITTPPLSQIYESDVALLPLFPSVVIQTDQLIVEVATCLAQTPYREIRLIYCDPPTRTVRVLCSRFQGDQDFHHIFQRVEEATGWQVKVDVWEELAPIIALPIPSLSHKKEEVGLNNANGQRLSRKTTSEREITKEETDLLEKKYRRTAEKLVNQIGKQLQSSQYQATQTHFRIIVPGVTEQEKLRLRTAFQHDHPEVTLGVAAHF